MLYIYRNALKTTPEINRVHDLTSNISMTRILYKACMVLTMYNLRIRLGYWI